ncbi:MAG TPA: BadF/BadG/BcrA/BcrD ATPase family protein, partial [Herbaspirillum sp.]|nr:BadF/BadG/BcrA/BcrD ATPase family protein [Herbaspirillum sp.]
MTAFDYLIGIDGGGSKTTARIAAPNGKVLAEASTGPSALAHGVEKAWPVIVDAIRLAFGSANLAMPDYTKLAVGIGLAGMNVAHWAEQFRAGDPGFGALLVESDATTTLLGAHRGQQGAIIAIGTGTIGAAINPDGSQHIVDGWGFPSGDDASGAWMGLRAINQVQRFLDGRAATGPLVLDVIAFCVGNDSVLAEPNDQDQTTREAVLNWLTRANQSLFAQLARLVVKHADDDPAAHEIMTAAGAEIGLMAQALDPSEKLPLALCGGLATSLRPYLPATLQKRTVPPWGDAASGALLMIQRHLEKQPARSVF